MTETILQIAGKPGLFRLVKQGRGMLIVETIDDQKRRIPAGARDRVTSLNDVSMYTEEDDVPLMEIFQHISDNLGGKPSGLDHKTATNEQVVEFMTAALPTYDRDRVHLSDMRRLIQWYNILSSNGYTTFVEEETADAEKDAAEPEA